MNWMLLIVLCMALLCCDTPASDQHSKCRDILRQAWLFQSTNQNCRTTVKEMNHLMSLSLREQSAQQFETFTINSVSWILSTESKYIFFLNKQMNNICKRVSWSRHGKLQLTAEQQLLQSFQQKLMWIPVLGVYSSCHQTPCGSPDPWSTDSYFPISGIYTGVWGEIES